MVTTTLPVIFIQIIWKKKLVISIMLSHLKTIVENMKFKNYKKSI